MEVMLAIDGGGSRTRCLAIDERGRTLGRGEAGPSNHLLVARESVVGSLTEAIDQALANGGLCRADVVGVSAGLAGVDYDGTGAEEMEGLFREFGYDRPVINGDMVIAHYGALGGRPGVLALSGTGSAILGIGTSGERVKVGGWGPVFGDEGSAYRIGQMSLFAAAKAYDGRGPATALLDAILRALGLGDFKETLARVYLGGVAPREIAALSRVAYEVAESGDEVARAIFRQAGEELADSVVAAIARLGLEQADPLVSYQGTILTACALVRERFSEAVRRRCPRASILTPRFAPVIGAYLLGCEVWGWASGARSLFALEAGAAIE